MDLSTILQKGHEMRQAIGNIFQQGKTMASNFAADLPFNVDNAKYSIREAVLPHTKFMTPERSTAPNPALQMSPIHALQNYGFDNEVNTLEPYTEKSGSANFQQFIEPPEQDTRLNALKQAVLASSNLRPAAQQFFSKIPITGRYGLDPNAGGQAFGISSPYFDFKNVQLPDDPWEYYDAQAGPRFVGLDPQLVQKALGGDKEAIDFIKGTILHEMLHQSPRQFGSHDTAVQAFNKVKKDKSKDPTLYNEGLKYFRNGSPPPNPEEFWAAAGENMGQQVLQDPIVGSLYQHIFNKPGK